MTTEQMYDYIKEKAGDVYDIISSDCGANIEIQDIYYGYSDEEDIIKRLNELIARYRTRI